MQTGVISHDQPDFKALVDMSCGTLGYCGFAQESRVLRKATYRADQQQPRVPLFCVKPRAPLSRRRPPIAACIERYEAGLMPIRAEIRAISLGSETPWKSWRGV